MAARMLIIEDDPDSLELAAYLLESAGHTTLRAPDGEAGMQLALQESPDLVICDLQIPRMDGHAVVRALRANPKWRRVPVIAVTALSMPGDREKTLAAGFDGFLSKPVTPETFVQQIESFLPPV
jgi:two-component system cell cycle response regulator DivK